MLKHLKYFLIGLSFFGLIGMPALCFYLLAKLYTVLPESFSLFVTVIIIGIILYISGRRAYNDGVYADVKGWVLKRFKRTCSRN